MTKSPGLSWQRGIAPYILHYILQEVMTSFARVMRPEPVCKPAPSRMNMRVTVVNVIFKAMRIRMRKWVFLLAAANDGLAA